MPTADSLKPVVCSFKRFSVVEQRTHNQFDVCHTRQLQQVTQLAEAYTAASRKLSVIIFKHEGRWSEQMDQERKNCSWTKQQRKLANRCLQDVVC
jgi:hypothetical protein